jgi:hypothetical protein
MEAAGAVFLPAAGSRSNTTVNFVNDQGYYWSTTHFSTASTAGTSAKSMSFTDVKLLLPTGGFVKSHGFSVRLVHKY